jgi:hypothetical protein
MIFFQLVLTAIVFYRNYDFGKHYKTYLCINSNKKQ